MLTRVDDDVLGQVPHVHKSLATHAAFVWADIVMVADVIGQLAGLDESAGPKGGRALIKLRKARTGGAGLEPPNSRSLGKAGLGQQAARFPTKPVFRGPHNTQGTGGESQGSRHLLPQRSQT